jgi:hypothetical protein
MEPALNASKAAINATRFTSNIVGPLLFLRDMLSFLLAFPVALIAYEALFGSTLEASVHFFCRNCHAGSFILLRVSKDSYLQNLFTLNERGDSAVFDALLSGLVATALVFLSGHGRKFLARGQRPVRRQHRRLSGFLALAVSTSCWGRMARAASSGSGSPFYGADPGSIEAIQRCWLRATLATSTLSAWPMTGPSCPTFPASASSAGSDDLAAMAVRARSTRC